MNTMDDIDLFLFEKQVYSEYGQDGVIEKIFECIGTTNKEFVEFGSNGTKTGKGNTPYLREVYGWSGLLMDYTENPYNITYSKDYDVKYHKITASNINDIFIMYTIPQELDFLSIDIDGQDFHVWNTLKKDVCYPRVVSIECCWDMFFTSDYVMEKNEDFIWNGNHLYGASVTALYNLGKSKGYTLLTVTGPDCIFVRSDILLNKPYNFKNANNVAAIWDIYNEREGAHIYPRLQKDYISSSLFKSSNIYLNSNI